MNPDIIFDWSGTLSDDRLPILRANRMVFLVYGKEPLEFDEWLENATGTAHLFYQSQGITDPEAVVISRRFFNEFVHQGLKPVMYPDVAEVLEVLNQHGSKMGVLSAHPQASLEREACEYGIDKYFEFMTGGVTNKSEMLRDIANKIGGRQVYYVGDTLYDMQAASSAGFIPIGVGDKIEGHPGKFRGYNEPERLRQEAGLVFSDLYDLVDYLLG